MDEMEKEGGALLYYLADVYYPLDYMELPGNLGVHDILCEYHFNVGTG